MKSETKTALLELADQLDKVEPSRFDMDAILRWGSGVSVHLEQLFSMTTDLCGAVGCIAGWALLMGRGNGKLAALNKLDLDRDQIAQMLLGLDGYEARDLFYPSSVIDPTPYRAGSKDAAWVLRWAVENENVSDAWPAWADEQKHRAQH